MTLTKLRNRLRKFYKDTSGVVALEMVVFLPLLFWSFAAVAVFFDAYRARSTAEKAAFTISDMLSRETNAIDETYISNTLMLFDALADSQDQSSMRVSVISWSSATESYEVDWSEARGLAYEELLTADLDDMLERLPLISEQDTLILVETLNDYQPVLDVGIGDISIDTFVFTRPRYAPQLVFSSTT